MVAFSENVNVFRNNKGNKISKLKHVYPAIGESKEVLAKHMLTCRENMMW